MLTTGESSRRCGEESELFSFALGYLLGCSKVPGLARVHVKSWPPASWLQGRLLVELPSVHNQIIKSRMFLVRKWASQPTSFKNRCYCPGLLPVESVIHLEAESSPDTETPRCPRWTQCAGSVEVALPRTQTMQG